MEIANLLNQKLPFAGYVNYLRQPEIFLFAILAGNEIADYFGSFFLANAVTKLLDEKGRFLAFSFFGFLGFYVGDFIPKVIGYHYRRSLFIFFLPLLHFLYKISTPLNSLLQLLTKFFPEKKKSDHERMLSPAEQFIIHLMEEAKKQGKISEMEMRFIKGLFISEDLKVSVVMVPRSEIFALPDQPLTEELYQRLSDLPYSKIPIYKNSLDDVIGILYVKDLFKHYDPLKNNSPLLSQLVRPAHFFPEFMKVRDLLFTMQRKHLKVALIVDEYGSLKGLITLDDLLDVFFGEMRSYGEGSSEWENIPIYPQKLKNLTNSGEYKGLYLSSYLKLSQDTYLVHGNTLLYELREIFPIDNLLEEEKDENQTLNGFLLKHFQGIPKVGDQLIFGDWKFKIAKIKKNKIIWIEISKV